MRWALIAIKLSATPLETAACMLGEREARLEGNTGQSASTSTCNYRQDPGARSCTWTTKATSQGAVLCHHSPRWISRAFGQHPLYLDGDPYICTTALYKPCYSSLPSLRLLTSTFCFWPTFASA